MWQPIETAPKGEQVMIYSKGNRISTARFENMPFVGEYWYVVVPCAGGFGTGSDTCIRWIEDMPTHWMPLPEPPSSNVEVRG